MLRSLAWLDLEAGVECLPVHPNFAKTADFRLPSGSPAIDAGVPLPSDWSDPSREHEKGKPDAGAIPSGGDRLKVGRNGRLSF